MTSEVQREEEEEEKPGEFRWRRAFVVD